MKTKHIMSSSFGNSAEWLLQMIHSHESDPASEDAMNFIDEDADIEQECDMSTNPELLFILKRKQS